MRPTKDIARESMFSALDARGALEDAIGARPLRGHAARSRSRRSRAGAERAVLVERDRAALDAIGANLEDARPRRPGPGRAAPTSAGSSAGRRPPEAPFDLVFVDPPYDTPDDEITELLAVLDGAGVARARGAIVSVERPRPVRRGRAGRAPTGWERTFGDTLLTFFVAFSTCRPDRRLRGDRPLPGIVRSGDPRPPRHHRTLVPALRRGDRRGHPQSAEDAVAVQPRRAPADAEGGDRSTSRTSASSSSRACSSTSPAITASTRS